MHVFLPRRYYKSRYDNRVKFKNLRKKVSLNPLSNEEIQNLWMPNIRALNGLEEFYTFMNEDEAPLYQATVRREGNSTESEREDSALESEYTLISQEILSSTNPW